MTELMLFDNRSLPQNRSGLVTKIPPDRIDAYFVRLWATFPKRRGNNPKWQAQQKFKKLVENGENPETIIAGAERFAAECSRNGITGSQYVPQMVTWLNGKMWLNDPDAGTDDQPKSFIDMARDLRERAYATAEQEPAGLLSGDER